MAEETFPEPFFARRFRSPSMERLGFSAAMVQTGLEEHIR